MAAIKTPKYYRQRFLLLLLEMSGGQLSKTDFQKLLFLSQKEAGFNYYNFVPYHYGCYSFQAQSDIELMEAFGWLKINEKSINLLAKPKAFLKNNELITLSKFTQDFKNYRGQKLITYVYKKFPYYAIRSKIASKILNDYSLKNILTEKEKLVNQTETIYTIGYEGISFETYINKLIIHDIKLLCDIRKNPLSRKFGFSKGTLSQVLPKFGIKYLHIPDLGIPSEFRQDLNSDEDYKNLFVKYKELLPHNTESLKSLEELFKKYKRIALTCFEKEHQSCHRHCVSDYLKEKNKVRICHL